MEKLGAKICRCTKQGLKVMYALVNFYINVIGLYIIGYIDLRWQNHTFSVDIFNRLYESLRK